MPSVNRDIRIGQEGGSILKIDVRIGGAAGEVKKKTIIVFNCSFCFQENFWRLNNLGQAGVAIFWWQSGLDFPIIVEFACG